MGGFGVMDFMVKSYRSNRGLLKGSKKSLKKIYQDNNLYYIKKKIEEKTKEYNIEKKKIFLEKFHAKQKKVRKRQTILLVSIIGLTAIIFLIIIQ